MKLKLVSFVLCPYVQRAVLLLLEKKVPFEIAYVDLANKPAWLLEISPRGKVPVLVVDGTPLFESEPICEFLDETGPEPRLVPTDPVLRARDRAWFAYADDVFATIYQRTNATEPDAYAKAEKELRERLARLGQDLGSRAWLSGDGTRFGMADVAFAPAFTRLALLAKLGSFAIGADLANVKAWGDRILARESVQHSVRADFEEQSIARLREKGALSVK